MWSEILLAICGLSFGLVAAGGVFTVLISVGLIPRFAGKTHTADHVFLYEDAVVTGTILGALASLFSFGSLHPPAWLAVLLQCIYGGFSGVFVGCLALAIAEMLNAVPVFARRTGFRKGLGIAVLAMALGKLAGSLVYFIVLE